MKVSVASGALMMLVALAIVAPAGARSTEAASAVEMTHAAPDEETLPGTSRRILVMLHMPPEHYRPTSGYGQGGGYGDLAAEQARRRMAARLARRQGLKVDESWPMPILGVDCVVMDVPGSEPLTTVAERMSHQPGVAWSQPLNEFIARGAMPRDPNDRLFAAQPAARAWHLAALHRVTTGRGVKVAVIDSMVGARHADLKGRVATVRDFVGGRSAAPELHGTAVAGIIAAQEDNGVGIVGVAPGAQLLALRACWQRSSAATVCDSLSLARALVFAIENGARVINMSLSGPDDLLIARLVQAGLKRGLSVVAAVDPRTGSGFPASIPGVVAVAEDGPAMEKPGVYNAPGRDVPTADPGGGWCLVSGNSYAAAHVSGLLALARQVSSDKRGHMLASSRADGGEVDACGTIMRAMGSAGSGCALAAR